MHSLFQKFLVFDLANLVWRATSVKIKGGDQITTTGVRAGHIYRTFNSILSAKKNFGGQLFFVTEGREIDRFQIHPQYKAGRATIKDSFDPFPDVQEMLMYLYCSFITPIGAEADDGIATICRQNTTARITIISADHDLWACLGDKVSINNGKNIYQQDVQKTFKVSNPLAIPLVKALKGDRSDNVPGVPRLRWVDVNNVMQNCIIPDDLYSNLDQIPEKTRNKLIDYEEQVRKMFKVTSLKTCKYNKDEFSGNKQKLVEFLQRFECFSLVDKVDLLINHDVP